MSSKEGLVDFARALRARDVSLLSTGGTAALLRAEGIEVTDVSAVTGFPEIMDGRVKTLHPLIHGALLGRRSIDEAVMQQHGIEPIDLVGVNLYPFSATIAKPGCSFEEAIENIDVGGPAMVRSAAKNHRFVAVVTDPADYGRVLDGLEKSGGALSDELRRELAAKAFGATALYDAAIARWFSGRPGEPFPDFLIVSAERVRKLRYGENPHQ
ncbi:MAG: bifunctional phosphoribosylaminoimidazolecarboxamide formyltransferase/IMP cyclohydrolase, partial [Steroidobacteraceae bacterium]